MQVSRLRLVQWHGQDLPRLCRSRTANISEKDGSIALVATSASLIPLCPVTRDYRMEAGLAQCILAQLHHQSSPSGNHRDLHRRCEVRPVIRSMRAHF
jgi:hypothetical protein